MGKEEKDLEGGRWGLEVDGWVVDWKSRFGSVQFQMDQLSQPSRAR